MKNLVTLLILLVLPIAKNNAQENILHSSEKEVIFKQDNKKHNWNLNKALRPDINIIHLKDTSAVLISYISKMDSLSFKVKIDTLINFQIVVDKDTFPQQIKGQRFIPKANYPVEFQKEKLNLTEYKIPEMYELVSIIIALTEAGLSKHGMVNRETEYYKRVINYFEPYKNEKVVQDFQEFINHGGDYYLRTNGLAFNFDRHNKIERSLIYDRIVYDEFDPNFLQPFISEIQKFSDKTDFRDFYKENKEYYDSEIYVIQNTINVKEIISWLRINFPSVDYNYYNIIISPLTGYTQGLIMFDYNNFSELQVHINLPYNFQENVTPHNLNLWKGNILFTELNHGFVNKEADKYYTEINDALLSKRDKLITDKFGKGYYGSSSETFKEYMNWGLVALRYLDFAEKEDLDFLLKKNIEYMQDRRGFLKFGDFQNFLVELYQNRKQDSNIANLYPSIINWFSKQ